MTRDESAALAVANMTLDPGPEWMCVDVWVNPEVVTYRYVRVPVGETPTGWNRTWTDADTEVRIVTKSNDGARPNG